VVNDGGTDGQLLRRQWSICAVQVVIVMRNIHLPDDKAAEQLARIANLPPAEIASLDKAKRNAILRMAHDAGISIRQLARLTGLGKTVVEHALKV
jgi:hypothetical protein